MKYDLWVRPRPYTGSDHVEGPTPHKAGLSSELLYLVLGVHDNGEMSAEAYFSVVNENGEMWFVSNRHFIVEDVTHNDRPIAVIKNVFVGDGEEAPEKEEWYKSIGLG